MAFSTFMLVITVLQAYIGHAFIKDLVGKYGWGAKHDINEFKQDLNKVLESSETGFAAPDCGSNDTCAMTVMGMEKQLVLVEKTTSEAGEQAKRDVLEAQKRFEAELLEVQQNMRSMTDQHNARMESIKQEMEAMRLQQEARQRQQEAERQQRFGFAGFGDPILCATANGSILNETCVEYIGPAATVCFDEAGAQAIHFVGVTDEDGSNAMSDDAFWVGEVATLVLARGNFHWKLRDDTGKHEALLTCDTSFKSDMPVDWKPSAEWLGHFQHAKSFLLHEMQPRIMRGPQAGTILSMLSDPDVAALRLKVRTARLEEHLNEMLMMQGYAVENNIRGKIMQQLAMHTIAYSLAARMK